MTILREEEQIMTRIKVIQARFNEMVGIFEELHDLAEKEGICPHCAIMDIADVDPRVVESMSNLYNRIEDKKAEVIRLLRKFEPSLNFKD